MSIDVDYFAKNNAEYVRCVVEEMKLIQDIIKRMANNSFLIKAWTVSVVVISLIFKSDLQEYLAAVCGIIVISTFWFLDAYYLRNEKRFRLLSETLVLLRKDINSIESKPLFCFKFMNIKENTLTSFFRMMVSIHLSLFYLTALLMLLLSRFAHMLV